MTTDETRQRCYNRVTRDSDGLDEIVVDGGAHLERMDKNDWFLALYRADGSAICLHIEGRIIHEEERPA